MRNLTFFLFVAAALVACGDPEDLEDLGDTGDTDNGVHPGDDDDDDDDVQPGDPRLEPVQVGGLYWEPATGKYCMHETLIPWSTKKWHAGYGIGGADDWCEDNIELNTEIIGSDIWYCRTLIDRGVGSRARWNVGRTNRCTVANETLYWGILEPVWEHPLVWTNLPSQLGGLSLCAIRRNWGWEAAGDTTVCNDT